jgi:hypothetical protein
VSGYIHLWGSGGLIEASSISGQVTLDNGGDVRLRASSVSGSVKARARRFYGMTVNTTSGGIAVAGALDPSGDYRADSISGSVSLTPMSGVTAELRTISGGVTSELENRVEGGRGFWRAIVGDGRTYFKVNSTSGGLRILAPGPDVEPTQPAPADSMAEQAEGGQESEGQSAALDRSPAGPANAGDDRLSAEESWTVDELPDAAPSEGQRALDRPQSNGSRSGGSPEELDVLRALERGEISVDEAAAKLERARRSGDA